MIIYIYKIKRGDGQLYIGSTKKERLKGRMASHSRSKRFIDHTFKYTILEKCDENNYMEREAFYVALYDSYNNGLNLTPDGSGNNYTEKFTTLGYKHSEETKRKISKAKKGKPNYKLRGRKQSLALRNKLSRIRKGKRWTYKLSESNINEILNLYDSNIEISGVGKVQKNGVVLTYARAFANRYHKKYNVTNTCLYDLVIGKTWKNVHKKRKI